MCTNLQTKAGQEWIPDFLKDTTGTSVTIPKNTQPKQPRGPQDVPLGDGLADTAKTAIMTRRERIRRAVEGE